MGKAAVRGVVTRHLKPPRLPPLLSHHTIHLKAKAAVAVYEAVAESLDEERPMDEPST